MLISRLRPQRGMTLLETVIVVAIAALAASLFAGMLLSSKTGAISGTRYAFISAMNLVSTEAMGNSTGNGATLVITASTNGTKLDVYAGRPNGNGMGNWPVHSVTAPLQITATGQNGTTAASAIAIFVDSFGEATYKNWAYGSGNLAALPACSPSGAALAMSVPGGETINLTACSAKFTVDGSGGTPLPEPS